MVSSTEYRSDVFSMIMQEPKYALQVYNALNGTSYDDPDMVTVVLNEQGFSLSIRNDSTFYVNSDLNFYEHQSTVNPNIALRQLRYFVNEIEGLIKDKDIFGSRLIELPTPRFAVFYNGSSKQPETLEYRLSDAFQNNHDPQIELVCKMYNINPGNNDTMIKKCEALSGYQAFVEKTRELISSGIKPEDAVKGSIDYCVSKEIMADFFKKKRLEVEKVTVLDYTFERRLELTARDSRAEGFSEGKAEGFSEGEAKGKAEGFSEGKVTLLLEMIKDGEISIESAAKRLNMTPEEFAKEYKL